MTAPLPMGGQKITGMADPAVPTDGATKNYVDTTTAAFFSTGDVKLTLKTVADAGWVLFDDGTIGSSSSGASSRANNDTLALFTLFFNNLSDTTAPLLTSGGSATTRAGQVSAANAWAANCRMSLPKTLGRALAVAGTGSGLSARTLGQTFGQESVSLVTANLPPYAPSGTITNGAITISHNANQQNSGASVNAGGNPGIVTNAAASISASQAASTFTGAAQGGTSAAFTNMQPTLFLNVMAKL